MTSETKTGKDSGSGTITCPTCGFDAPASALNCPKDGTVLIKQLNPGAVLAEKYEIMSTLGAGGMGIVYKARQSFLRTVVAIKMMHAHSASPERIARFHREAQAAVKLRHSNIASVVDFGLTAANQPYMVMDFVDGQPLSALIAQFGSIPTNSALTLFIQVCEAISYVHGNGVLHRDLKPSNLIVSDYNSAYPTVKVVDFGIAKVNQPDSIDLTQSGEICGSPVYMSPEQIQGKNQDVRSDVYSFGCVMYEALTGAPPFVANNSVATMFMHLTDSPKPMSNSKRQKEFPAALEQIVAKTLEKSADKRFQSMDELAAALKQFKQGKFKVKPELPLQAIRIACGVIAASAVCASLYFGLNIFPAERASTGVVDGTEMIKAAGLKVKAPPQKDGADKFSQNLVQLMNEPAIAIESQVKFGKVIQDNNLY
ncbi:MAG: serine/threonine protein kinase, partial [Terriglobales bacterium]